MVKTCSIWPLFNKMPFKIKIEVSLRTTPLPQNPYNDNRAYNSLGLWEGQENKNLNFISAVVKMYSN